MLIAIPTSDGKLDSHFGHCKQFVLIKVDESTKNIVSQEVVNPPPHEPGSLPKWLIEQQVNLVIAGGMGHKAKDILEERGVQVLVGAPIDAPDNLVKSYLAGELSFAENHCDH